MSQARLLLAAVAALVAFIGMLPMFGSTAYAAGIAMNGVVSLTEFSFPGAPVSKTMEKVSDVQAAPFLLSLADNVDPLFPEAGELLLDMTELIVYDNGGDLPPACTGRSATQVCVTARAKVGSAKQHPTGTQAKLATQLTVDVTEPPAQGTLGTSISEAQDPPSAITVTNEADFGTSGHLTISHQGTEAFGPTAEYFEYDRSCGTASQLCLIGRALQANGVRSDHPANGFPQPGGPPGQSIVDRHEQIQVKSNAGFFPTGNLLLYTIHTQEDPLGGDAELVSYANVQDIKTPSATEFHLTSRGEAASTFKQTPIGPHLAGAIVTGADELIVSRQKNESPVPGLTQSGECDDECVANSVGTFQVAYMQFQPNGPPKSLGQLNVPITGQAVILLNALNQPFTSTGGFDHLFFGPVPLVDTNGTKDGTLNLISPCIADFTPGINLQVTAVIFTDKSHTSPDSGEILAVFDTIHDDDDPFTAADNCDDPAGTSETTITAYIYPGDPDPCLAPPGTCSGTSDDDTDGDGCTDDEELDNNKGTGGMRDPWNPYDFFDPDENLAVAIIDIFGVAGKFGATAGPPATGGYLATHDRGDTYGPFAHNLSAPNGSITIGDVFAVAGQFGHTCAANSTF